MERSVNISGLASGLAKVSNLETINGRLAKFGINQSSDLADAAGALAVIANAKTQGEVAVLMVNLTNGTITPEQLTNVLKVAFPNCRVGARHGPHYLSKCRTGKLTGVEDVQIKKAAKTTKAAEVIVPTDDQLETEANEFVKMTEEANEQFKTVDASTVEETPIVVEEAPIVVEAPKGTYDDCTVEELRNMAKVLGVSSAGGKAKLIARIMAAE